VLSILAPLMPHKKDTLASDSCQSNEHDLHRYDPGAVPVIPGRTLVLSVLRRAASSYSSGHNNNVRGTPRLPPLGFTVYDRSGLVILLKSGRSELRPCA
jgi:hypothetical protein